MYDFGQILKQEFYNWIDFQSRISQQIDRIYKFFLGFSFFFVYYKF
jgi:hypothetical protein